MAEPGQIDQSESQAPPPSKTKGLRAVISRTKELEEERKGIKPNENQTVRRRHSIAKAMLEHQGKKLQEAEKELTHDPLTELRAKALFDPELDQEISNVERDRRSLPLELTVMDIDNFGAFNKQYGIPTGDEVLKMVGTTVNHTLRSSDSAFRLGGEEIAVISRRTHDPEKTGDKFVSERHNESIRNSVSENGHKVTISAGQTDYIRGENKKKFMDRANTALIVAKKIGKDRAVIADVVNGEEVYTDTKTKVKYTVLKDNNGKILEIRGINI